MAENAPSHAEMAKAYVRIAIGGGLNKPVAQQWIALAQVEATLAAAEEQKRIADWLEAWPLAFDNSPVITPNQP